MLHQKLRLGVIRYFRGEFKMARKFQVNDIVKLNDKQDFPLPPSWKPGNKGKIIAYIGGIYYLEHYPKREGTPKVSLLADELDPVTTTN
jgi:hypothetical protein